jgi:hypothetical protein
MSSYSPSATDSLHNPGAAAPSTHHDQLRQGLSHPDLPYQVMVVVSAVLLVASLWVF